MVQAEPRGGALLALAASLTLFIAIGSSVQAWRFRQQNDDLQFEQRRTRASLSLAERLAHEAQLALGESLVSEGAALQRTGLVGQRFESLDRLGKAARILGADPEGRKRLPDIRNHAITALTLTDLRLRGERNCGDVFGIQVDATLERYAVMEKSGTVVVRRLNDDRELVRLPAPDRRDYWWGEPHFSPDGELLVAYYQLGGEGFLLRIWHLGRRELLGSVTSAGGVNFHPDGRRLLFRAIEGGIAIWDRDQRRVVRRLPLDFTPSGCCLDREGRRLAVNNADPAAPRVVIIQLETGQMLADWKSQVGIGSLSFSTDGRLLAVGGGGNDNRVYVWNVPRGALASVLPETNTPLFAHSGYLLAEGGRLWDAASGEPLVTAPGAFLAFSRDDHRMALQNAGKIGVWDVALAPECRTLHPAMLGNRTETRDAINLQFADVSPDGRVLATSDGDGVRLWELDTGRELAELKASPCVTVLFHPDGQSLISSGEWGLYSWPIRGDSERGPDAFRVGPPELLRESAAAWRTATWLPDHRNLALVDDGMARVEIIDSSHPHPAWSRAVELDSGGNRRMIAPAVSPDGRWLAVGGWYEPGVLVWDLHRRQRERVLRPNDAIGDTKFFVGFSADGHWLISSTHPDSGRSAYHFWRVGTWELDHQISSERTGIPSRPPVSSGDGRLMALGIDDAILLTDAATGRELARLTTLQPLSPAPLAFSPDGTKLIAATRRKTALVWDLRLVREQLAPLGLDWDAPPYPSASAPGAPLGPLPPPRPVRVIGEVIEPQARRASKLVELNRRLTANHNDAEALIHRGSLFAQQKQWPRAIADLERFLRLRPGDSDGCWLLAEAYQETGNLKGAAGRWTGCSHQRPTIVTPDFNVAALPWHSPGRTSRSKTSAKSLPPTRI